MRTSSASAGQYGVENQFRFGERASVGMFRVDTSRVVTSGSPKLGIFDVLHVASQPLGRISLMVMIRTLYEPSACLYLTSSPKYESGGCSSLLHNVLITVKIDLDAHQSCWVGILPGE